MTKAPDTHRSQLIVCECCADNGESVAATEMVPSSHDRGVSLTFSPVCAGHAEDWWDGADWDGRHLHKPIH